jgi:hypothetical protein
MHDAQFHYASQEPGLYSKCNFKNQDTTVWKSGLCWNKLYPLVLDTALNCVPLPIPTGSLVHFFREYTVGEFPTVVVNILGS